MSIIIKKNTSEKMNTTKKIILILISITLINLQAKKQTSKKTKEEIKAAAKEKRAKSLAISAGMRNDKADTNHDHQVDEQEARAEAERLLKITKKGFNRIVAKIDTDKNGIISDKELQKLASHLQKIKKRYSKLDTNGDWKISKQEELQFLQKIMQKYKKVRESIIKAFDKNGDGKLNQEELQQLQKLIAIRRKKTEERKKKFDLNKDGKLDKNELKAMKAELKKIQNERIKKLLAKYDLNKDGKIDPQERKEAQRRIRANRIKNKPWAKFDTNKNGILDKNEKTKYQEFRKTQAKKQKKARWKRTFIHEFDKDKDGKLSPEEKENAINNIMKYL